ncbi:hypothetical protein FUT79_08975 [Treponema phagedenis]|uniref:hypothetical protein n=1 Tax=Treponema phagedenis TaxID=162 RepID=UPI0011E8928A|nr:hypothetical protein [Treponema phagedenis]QEJ95321.1 hypothetical protein FUT79_08975 [Treponema phagedenis]
MKKTMFVFTTVFLACVLTSCNPLWNIPKQKRPLIGTWSGTYRYSYEAYGQEHVYVFEFEKDKIIITKWPETSKNQDLTEKKVITYTYSVDGNVIRAKREGYKEYGNDLILYIPFSIQDNTLTLVFLSPNFVIDKEELVIDKVSLLKTL